MITPSATLAQPTHPNQQTRNLLALGVLAAWFILILVMGLQGSFQGQPSSPPLGILLAAVVPPALFGLAYKALPEFRNFALGVDLRLLTALQAWRVIGVMFLVLHAFDLLPALFAYPAGLGDVA